MDSGESGADVELGSAGPSGWGGQVSGDPAAGPAGAGAATPAEPVRPGAVDWLLVAFVTLLSAGTALVGVAYLPWHVGPVPVPVSALLGVGAMILAPRACYRLTGSMAAAALPVAVWFGVTVWLVLQRNPMMLSQALSVVQGQWRVMVLLGLGSLAAAATLTLLWAERTQARYARTAADGMAGPPGSRPAAADPATPDPTPVGAEADEPPARST
ncbi:hypothetical protein [Nakamurella sp.]|uniref:hypothetical protein n=1 Tax=Nakamurella sp. TaxID=1869182 RepID=UPI0037840918